MSRAIAIATPEYANPAKVIRTMLEQCFSYCVAV
jgi:hypothetical protein